MTRTAVKPTGALEVYESKPITPLRITPSRRSLDHSGLLVIFEGVSLDPIEKSALRADSREVPGDMKTSGLFGSSVILLFVCSFCLAAEPKRTTLGLTSRVGSVSLPFVVAEEKGFFKSEGLNTVVVMQNQVVVQGVLSRNVDYGGTFSNFVRAALASLWRARLSIAVMRE
jgi:hypothetical protein